MKERQKKREKTERVQCVQGYKPKTMVTGFLAPFMRQVVHPVRRLPQHSTIVTGGTVNLIPIPGAATRYTSPPRDRAPYTELNTASIFEFIALDNPRDPAGWVVYIDFLDTRGRGLIRTMKLRCANPFL